MIFGIVKYVLRHEQDYHVNLHSRNLSVFQKLDPFSINTFLLCLYTVHTIQPPPASLIPPKFESHLVEKKTIGVSLERVRMIGSAM